MIWSLRFSQIWKASSGKHILSFHRQRYFSMKVDSKQLAKLRKNTGYGLSVCKEALLENDNDVGLAQTWLDEQAIKKGWQKAEKLVGRKIGEGLIGVIVEGNHAAMVEVCCESDFVAKNEIFKDLVFKVTETALFHCKMIFERALDLGKTYTHTREVLLNETFVEMKLPHSDDRVSDFILQVVGRLGERIMVSRAVTMTVAKNCIIGSYSHGPFTHNVDGCLMGKYAALVALQPNDCDFNANTLGKLATSLSQHVVGMNPTYSLSNHSSETEKNDDGEVFEEQQYLMDETISVGELLHQNSVTVIDFLRMECGN